MGTLVRVGSEGGGEGQSPEADSVSSLCFWEWLEWWGVLAGCGVRGSSFLG